MAFRSSKSASTGLAAVKFFLGIFIAVRYISNTEGASYLAIGFNLCGSTFTDSMNVAWYGKTIITASSSGASCINTTSPISISDACTAPNCGDTTLQQMFQFSAIGDNLAYTSIGISGAGKKNTTYLITVYFADYISTAAGQNVFDIVINGETLETGVDVYALGGGNNQAVSLGLLFYSGDRSNFDVSFPTVVGTSMAAGIEFGFATSTNLTVQPPSATWGDSVYLESTVSSLNPNIIDVTSGSVAWYLNGVQFNTTTVAANADGTATASAYGDTIVLDCSGGTFNLTATYLGSLCQTVLMYSSTTQSYTINGACTTTPGPTTTVPATSTTPAPTTTETPTTTPEVTSTPPETTTTSPPTSTPTPSTSPALPSSTPSIPSTTPVVLTSSPLASTTLPPTSGNVTITVTMEFNPPQPQAGQPLTVFGEAVASSGPAPTGNVTLFVDGAAVASNPVVPQGGSGRRHLLQQSVSTFSLTILAPSTPGLHVITAIFFPTTGSGTGGSTPISTPITVTVEVVPATPRVAVAVSTPALHFPSCSGPLRVVASVTSSNGTVPPTGSVTLSIIGAKSPHFGAAPLDVTLASAPISGGAAEFNLHSVGKTAAAAQAFTGTTAGAKLLPGSYQLTAAYSGDTLYGTASGSSSLDVGVTCPLVSLTA